MKPLRVALVVKASPATVERERRNMGYWSYAVPELEWTHFSFLRGSQVDYSAFDGHDLIFCEDATGLEFIGKKSKPFVYLSIDSTLTEYHYQARLAMSQKADITLVDHDDLGRFPRSRRLGYCVNDHVFKPLEKSIDVSFHCSGGERHHHPGAAERATIRAKLGDICTQLGLSYRSGILELEEYAASMGASRIVVNWPRTPINRPHRVLDALACGACLVTGKIPRVSGDDLAEGIHYISYTNTDELLAVLKETNAGRIAQTAVNGAELVKERHTWAVRARELRELLNKELL